MAQPFPKFNVGEQKDFLHYARKALESMPEWERASWQTNTS